MQKEVEQTVIEKIESRRDAGRTKYQTTMERTDLSRDEWITHAQEEALDLAIYLEKLRRQKGSLEMVREFHATFGHPIETAPQVWDGDRNRLRIKLLREEVDELQEALENRDPVETLDALADIQVILDGSFLALGFAHLKAAALAEVHRSNMSKLGADGRPIYRADGKIQKGPAYSPPDLEQVLAQAEPAAPPPRSLPGAPANPDHPQYQADGLTH